MKHFLIYLLRGLGGDAGYQIKLTATPDDLYNPEEEAKKVVKFLQELPGVVVGNVLRNPYYRSDIERIAREPPRKL